METPTRPRPSPFKMNLKDKTKIFPDSPGVYLMKDVAGIIIYIGKATSLRERVRSYFSSDIPLKTRRQMDEVDKIEYQETESALEALLLESRLIRKYSPKYNIKEKDDKSRTYVHLTRENFPRVELVRETDLGTLEKSSVTYGPFISTRSVTQALEIIRKIVPYRSCKKLPKKKCLYGSIGLCDAPCIDNISQSEYRKNIRQFRNFFEGKKSRVLSRLKREMFSASKNQDYEEAAKLRDRLFALEHIKQMFVISKDDVNTVFRRIEGYDISNISGLYAVGSMVVFINGQSEKSEYRKFKIKLVESANDTAMMREVLSRRFRKRAGEQWPEPDLVLVDGGRGQVNVASSVMRSYGLDIPIVGLAKGPDRKKDELITSALLPRNEIDLFKQVRDEAHRFAKGYYQRLHRSKITRSN